MAGKIHMGAGRLSIEGEDCGPVVYSFSIEPDGNPRGVLSNNGALYRASLVRAVDLILNNTMTIRIEITEANNARALFKLDSPALFDLLDKVVSAVPDAQAEAL